MSAIEVPSELDLALINALQIRPRSSWRELAPILDASTATLARRWSRLTERGLAWMSTYPTVYGGPTLQVAFVEIKCSPQDADRICGELRSIPEVASLDQLAGDHGLFLTVVAEGTRALSSLILDRFPAIRGIEETRSQLAVQQFIAGDNWRLDALSPHQIRCMSEIPLHAAPNGSSSTPGLFEPIMTELASDGRITAAAISARIGQPEQTVRRQLATMQKNGMVAIRCEIAQRYSGSPLSVLWWCRLPTRLHAQAAKLLSEQSQVRLCTSVTGPANFLISTWSRSMRAAGRFQAWLESRLDELDIIDSTVILRNHKRMGWILEPDGRATGEVIPLVGTTPQHTDG